MTNFIDARAKALGITGDLSTDQRIALDLNAQVEKHQIAVNTLALATRTLSLTAAEEALLALQEEALRLHVFYDRHLYTSQGLDISSIPTVLP